MTGEIWEFAAIKTTEDGDEISRIEFFIEPYDLGNADPFSLKVGGFYDRYKKFGAYDKEGAARKIEKFTRGCTLIGNTVSFDAERLDRLLRSANQCPSWHYHVIDIEPMIIGYAAAKGDTFPLPYSSSDLSTYLGVEEPTEEERHTAMGDTEWVKRQWAALFWNE